MALFPSRARPAGCVPSALPGKRMPTVWDKTVVGENMLSGMHPQGSVVSLLSKLNESFGCICVWFWRQRQASNHIWSGLTEGLAGESLGKSASKFDLRSRSRSFLTRAPLGYFYNAPHWGGGYFEPPSDLRNYWTDSKNSSGIWKPWKNCEGNTNFIDLGVTSDVTGQVKFKMFDISDLVTSASKIAMLSRNKAN